MRVMLGVLFLFSQGVCAQESRLMKNWISDLPVSENRQVSVRLKLDFKPGKVKATSICTYADGLILKSSTEAAVRVEPSTIHFLESSSNQQTKGDRQSCVARLYPGTIGYSVTESKMVMYASDHDSLEFSLSR